MGKIKHENIDFSMIHFQVADKDGNILINADRLPKHLHNDVVNFFVDGFEPDIEKESVIYHQRIERASKEQLPELIELINERLDLCIYRGDNRLIQIYERLHQKAINKLSELKKQTDVKNTFYPEIYSKLREWIDGANDSVLSDIIKNKCLPDGEKKPIWKGSKPDAWRFAWEVDMTFPKDFNNCFLLKDGTKLHSKDKPKNKNGKIVDILKEIMKK